LPIGSPIILHIQAFSNDVRSLGAPDRLDLINRHRFNLDGIATVIDMKRPLRVEVHGADQGLLNVAHGKRVE
jgi:hypothetical protein